MTAVSAAADIAAGGTGFFGLAAAADASAMSLLSSTAAPSRPETATLPPEKSTSARGVTTVASVINTLEVLMLVETTGQTIQGKQYIP